MYSSKTKTLIRRIRGVKSIYPNVSCIVLTHEIDSRYAAKDYIVSHDLDKVDAVSTSQLVPFLYDARFHKSHFVFIEEGQFFDDLVEFVKQAVEIHGKYVTVCGLDGDYKRNPFTNIVTLIPWADDVVKLKAKCSKCGEYAPFSMKKTRACSNESTNIIDVGGVEKYAPVCREHYVDCGL